MGKKHVGLVLLSSLMLAAFRTFVVISNMEKNSYEKDTYYLLDNGMSKSFTVLFFICLAVAVLLAVAAGTDKKAIPDQNSSVVSASCCMLAFILLGTVLIYGVNYLLTSEYGGPLDIVIIIISIFTSAGFLMTGFRNFSENILSAIILLPLLLTIFRLISDFLSNTSAPMASSGAYHITGLAVLMLYFLCEGKVIIDKGNAVLYYLFGYISAILLSVYALPNLLLHCCGIFTFDYKASLSVVDILIVAYIFARLSSAKLVSDKKEDLIEIIEQEENGEA